MDYTKVFRLDGKAALVSGAARGIGAEIAMALAQSGAAVLVTDVNDGAGRETVARVRAAGGRAEFQHHDVTDEAGWAMASAAMLQHFGRYDILVNNAGIETAALFAQCEVADFRKVLDVNVTGVFLGIKHALRTMGEAGGAIVNLSSVAGLIGTTAHAAYHSSKGAVRSMTKAAAIECAQLKNGVRVNSIHPAIVQTDMGDKFVQDFVDLGLVPDAATAHAAFEAAHPLGFGRVEDVACAVLYLASDAARWVTGAELVVDGGYTAA
ncbi:glucose 1-dehydrogenase [Sinimarinibacterium sp. CAU 1509]|uniref:glucose 1-dehydrogenase n=1 Tax=Sinimarinibacterium sp. CAU 1509 TaxID=2562283 RepID=UPI0010ABA751|nr:glucose 1-dehydrogenase [Sinimarinibacterium sp. CAU 1509]TJY59788.1 glucose 1-dehydrogenase [Sinimarinibacterium sp. CAU 1509]